MFTVIMLTCSLINPNPAGCGPRTAMQQIEVGKANSEGECFVLGRANQPTDTPEIFHKIICVKYQ